MNNKDLNTLILCAFRYAIGRQTYMPPEIIRIILQNLDKLEPAIRRLIREEIRDEYRREPKWYDWPSLLKSLENHECNHP